MSAEHTELVRALCRSPAAAPTGAGPARLRRLPGIRAVLFDLYGTLFASARGDGGRATAAVAEDALREALAAVAIVEDGPPGAALALLRATIRQHQERARRDGIEQPEVDIVEVWRSMLLAAGERGWIGAPPAAPDLRRLAIEYECRVNPVWPMPGAGACLRTLREAGIALGVVSNAQFYSLELFPALLGAKAEELGFHPRLQLYSFRSGHAKPGLHLYRAALRELAAIGIAPHEALHVGNEMGNDVMPAAVVGLRTALFAGDRRSLRLDGAEELAADRAPDLVLTELAQLPPCLGITGALPPPPERDPRGER